MAHGQDCPGTGRRPASLRARFDRIFRRETDRATLDRLLARLHRRKSDLLRVLGRAEIPLRINGSENDIRARVTKRKVSCFCYLGDRLHVSGAITIPPLPDFVRQAAATA